MARENQPAIEDQSDIEGELDDEDEDLDFLEDDDDDDDSPSVANSKGGRMAIMGIGAVVVAFIFYMILFSDDPVEDVAVNPTEIKVTPSPAGGLGFQVAPPARNESEQEEQDIPDNIAIQDQNLPNADLFAQPELPSAPEIPDLPPLEIEPIAPIVPDIPELPVTSNIPEEITETPPTPQPVEAPPSGAAADPLAGFNEEFQDDSSPVNVNEVQRKQALEARRATSIFLIGGSGASGLTQDEEDQPKEESNITIIGGNKISELQESDTPQTPVTTRISDMNTTIVQGKMINAILETALNTDLPGTLRAIVSRNVFAEMGDNILIPKGSRLIGDYSTDITQGQKRVLINWSRIIRPDGVDIAINATAADQFGRSGIEGDVNNRYGEILSTSLLTSLLTVGGAVMVEKLTDSDGITQTDSNTTEVSQTSGKASDFAIAEATRSITDTALQITQNMMRTNPTIRIPQGTRIIVFVNGDLNIPAAKNVYDPNRNSRNNFQFSVH